MRNEITNGSVLHKTKRCREAQALTAFLWFCWFGYTVSIVLSSIAAKKFHGGPSVNLRHRASRRNNIAPAAPVRPGMAQV